MKKFTLLIMSTALLLFIAISLTPTIEDQTDYQAIAISAATDTGAGGLGFATAIDRTPAYATERPVGILPPTGMRSDVPTLTALGHYATGRDHRLSRKLDSHYIDVTLGAIVSHTTAPTTSTQPFLLRT